ncbi:MAG: phosphoenolpyruvate-utilizing N-terminal domain-containing protein, partial [Sedimentibacter sp.]
MKGLGVSPGIGIGKAFLIDKKSMIIEKIYVNDTEMEISKFRNAMEMGKNQLNELYTKTLEEVGEKEAQIFKSHEMMLEDDTFTSEVEIRIKNEKINADYALNETSSTYIKLFENIEDEYLRERAEDIKDVMTRVIKILLGINTTDYSCFEKNSIIIAKDLTPSDTAQIDKSRVSAMITETGGKTSHAAIIAR